MISPVSIHLALEWSNTFQQTIGKIRIWKSRGSGKGPFSRKITRLTEDKQIGPLADGILAGYKVECPWHGFKFDVSNWEVKNPPASEPKDESSESIKIMQEHNWVINFWKLTLTK
jgi:hypothetical protein